MKSLATTRAGLLSSLGFMVVDSSVVAAILFNEADAPQLRDSLSRDTTCYISTASVLELVIVLNRRNPAAGREPITGILSLFRLVETPITLEQSALAVQAFLTYGKGRHPARLNFGDCFSYALAKSLDEPLLFKGDDFRKTNVKIV